MLSVSTYVLRWSFYFVLSIIISTQWNIRDRFCLHGLFEVIKQRMLLLRGDMELEKLWRAWERWAAVTGYVISLRYSTL